MGFAILIVLLILYFVPTVVAASRGHRQAGAIFALNLFLGWTLIGWVAALVWSLAAQSEPQAVIVNNAYSAPGETDGLKTCPECAEKVKEEATICRYCRHEFTTREAAV